MFRHQSPSVAIRGLRGGFVRNVSSGVCSSIKAPRPRRGGGGALQPELTAPPTTALGRGQRAERRPRRREGRAAAGWPLVSMPWAARECFRQQ